MEHARFSERRHQATWKSENPFEATMELLAKLEADPDDRSIEHVLQHSELALRLRQPDVMVRSRTMLELHADNPWAVWTVAELDRLEQRPDALGQRLLELRASYQDLPRALQIRVLRLVSRADTALLHELAQRFPDDETLDSVLYHWGPDLRPEHPAMKRYVTRLSQHATITPAEASEVLTFMQGLPCPSNLHTEWTDPEATDVQWLTQILDRIEAAKAKRSGLSILRLSDGSFLRELVNHLAGAVGYHPDGRYRNLQIEEVHRTRELLTSAIENADVCAVPDLRYLLSGPPHGTTAAQWFLQRPRRHTNLVAGPVNLGFDLEALGLSPRLASLATGLIAPADPAGIPLFSASTPTWLQVPGDTYFTRRNPSSESHFHDYFERILRHPFKPGEVWLVAAGPLGKIYCEAIRQCGGVAVDIGSVFDLWAGRPDTRHPGRLYPWLAAPYVHRSAPHPAPSAIAVPNQSSGNKRLPRIRHVVNVVGPGVSPSLLRAQTLTIETLARARTYSSERVAVEVVGVGEPTDPAPDAWIRWEPYLNRTLKDFPEAGSDRPLPLLCDLLDAFWLDAPKNSSADPGWDIGIFTNVDVAVLPHFYDLVLDLYTEGFDAFTINKRIVDEAPLHWSSARMAAEVGRPHPGHDCFVFNPHILRKTDVDLVAVGIPKVGRALLMNLQHWANRFETFKGLHVTFHLDDDRQWTSDADSQARQFNLRAFERVEAACAIAAGFSDAGQPNV